MVLWVIAANPLFPAAQGNKWCYGVYYQYGNPENLCYSASCRGDTVELKNPKEVRRLVIRNDSVMLLGVWKEQGLVSGKELVLAPDRKPGESWDWCENGKAQVLRTETMTVPAGSFDCVVIKKKRWYYAGPEKVWETVIEWWARGVGMVKTERTLKTSTHSSGWTWELKSYTLK